MNELRGAGLALGLPVFRGPGQFGAERVRIARSIEEIIGSGFGLAACAGRVRQSGRIRAGDVRNLVFSDKLLQRFGIGRTPAENGGDLVARSRPLLVERDGARHLIAVVVGVDGHGLAADAAVLVHPCEGIDFTLAERNADVGRAARIIGQMADGDLRLRCAGHAAQQQRGRCGTQQFLDGHNHDPPVSSRGLLVVSPVPTSMRERVEFPVSLDLPPPVGKPVRLKNQKDDNDDADGHLAQE